MSKYNTIEVINRHGDAMGSRDPEVIVQDYAEDAVIITNLTDKPVQGHEEIKQLIEKCFTIDILFDDSEPTEIVFQEEKGEFGLHVFKKGDGSVFGVETYVVRDNKIVYESAYIETKEI